MNLIITNKHLKINKPIDGFEFYFLRKNDDFTKLKELLDNKKPEKIISLDFAIQTVNQIQDNSIIVAKETISINAKPINWAVPREDRWIDTSEELNKSICDILEKLTFQHYIGSGIELENAHSIIDRSNAKKWISDNLHGTFIDGYSARLNEIIQENSINISIIRIINSKFPIPNLKNKGFWSQSKRFLKELYFYKIKAKSIKNEIIDKNLFYEFSKII